MDELKVYVQHKISREFKNNKNVKETTEKIFNFHGHRAIT